jgi:TIR domain
VALRLYDDLAEAGHFPWLDEKDLLPGEDWPSRIEEEIRECKLFIALLSSRSLNRRGFVQKELRIALDVLDTIPVNESFLIPVRLDECSPRHERLRPLHRLDLFPDYAAGLRRLLTSLEQGRRTPGRLWIDVGIEIPPDIATWPDDRLFRYLKAVLLPEAQERAYRDYEYVLTDDAHEAIRFRTKEKLLEVARRFGFLESFERWLKQEQPANAGVSESDANRSYKQP